MAKKLEVMKRLGPSSVSPPKKLGVAGRELWISVMADYEITDSGGLAILELACQALDRAEACSARIAQDGPIVETKAGPKDHPLLRHELQNRGLVIRALHRLGLEFEPIKPIGRPGGSVQTVAERRRGQDAD